MRRRDFLSRFAAIVAAVAVAPAVSVEAASDVLTDAQKRLYTEIITARLSLDDMRANIALAGPNFRYENAVPSQYVALNDFHSVDTAYGAWVTMPKLLES